MRLGWIRVLALVWAASCVGGTATQAQNSGTTDVAARPTGRIEGRVTFDGAPASARIDATRIADSPGERDWDVLREALIDDRAADASTTSATDGSFALAGLAPGWYRLTAAADAGRGCVAEVEVGASGHRAVVDLRLFAPAGDRAVHGRVTGLPADFAKAIVLAAPRYVRDDGPSRPTQSAPIAADGTFVLSGLGPGPLTPVVVVPSRILVETQSVDPAGQDAIEVDVAAAAHVVTLRVVAGSDGKPVAGASVRCREEHGIDLEAFATTDADGVARFLAPRAEASAFVYARGFPRAKVPLDPSRDDAAVRLRRGPEVTARVITKDGAPVAGATVWWTTLGSFRRGGPVVTDAAGRARIEGMKPGRAHVFVADRAWASAGLEESARSALWGLDEGFQALGSSSARPPREGLFEVAASGEVTLDIAVERAREIRGRVTDEHGAPVEGALVCAPPPKWFPWPQVWTSPWSSAGTEADGSFVLQGVFPRGGQVVRAGDFAHACVEVTVPATDAPLELRFVASASPLVTVREKRTGAPVAGAFVDPSIDHIPPGVSIERWRWTSAADGSVRIGPLPLAPWEINVKSPAHVDAGPVEVDVERLRSGEPVVVEIDAGLAVTGRVLLPDGRPARVGTVLMGLYESGSLGGGDIAADGTFERRGLAPGRYEVKAQVEDGRRRYEGSVVVEAGGPPVELRLSAVDERPARATVRVVDADGEPVGGASSWVESSHFGTGGGFSGAVLDLGQIGEEGGGTLEIYAVVDASGRPSGAGAVSVKLPHPVPPDFVVHLPRDRPVRGRVTDEAGDPVAGVRVTAQTATAADRRFGFGGREGRVHGEATSGADGTFEIRGLGDFAYELEATPPATFAPPADVPVRGGADDVAIVLKKGLRPRVTVLGPSGFPVPRATVSVEGQGVDPVAEAATGDDGVATLPVLGGRGPFRLSVSPPSDAVALLAKTVDWTPSAETTVRLENSFTITGTIVDADGAPVPNAVYWIFRAGNFGAHRDTADQRGRFELRRLSAGDIAIAAGDFPWHQMSMPGWPSLDDPEAVEKLATRIAAGTRDARVPLDADRSLRVTLAGPDWIMPEEGTTTLFARVPEGLWRSEEHAPVVEDGGRTLLFTGLVPGREYRLLARAPGRGLVVWAEKLRAGQPVTATWSEGKDLVGKVVLPGRPELHDVEVRVTIGGASISTRTGRDGSFRIGALPPTRVSITVFASAKDGDWCGDFEATPGGEPVELSPKELPIPATPR